MSVTNDSNPDIEAQTTASASARSMAEPGRALTVRTPAELFGLADKVVIVTGASSGLGARWAKVLAKAGARVVLTARRDAELDAVAAGIPGAIAVSGDITSETHRSDVVTETLDRFGRIDVLVNNAGIAESRPALDTDASMFGEVLAVDLTGPFELTKLVGPAMIAAGSGSIVNVSSLGAERCIASIPLAAYNAAKAGLVALTRSFASEWGAHGIRVNAIGPAFFPTRLSDYLIDPQFAAWVADHTALRRTARADELDGTLLFLASDSSTFVTGQHLIVDGGWSVF